MNITTQTKPTAQRYQLQHRRVFMLNSPSDGVVANMVRQLNQQFKQRSNYTQFGIGEIKSFILVRVILHDAGLLLVQSMVNSLDPQLVSRLEQNELYYWKREKGVISNG